MNPSEGMPRKEYPRPQFKRKSYYCLNGEWDFAFDFSDSGAERGMMTGKGEYPLKITVPFCPESRLSGIGYTDFIPAVWYRRTLKVDEFPDERAILRFGAVDHSCRVWVNGVLCGAHRGGYTAFGIDITDALRKGDNVITVSARDDVRSHRQPAGKQSLEYSSHDCSYTRTTGIWQTVWLEWVPAAHLKRAAVTPHSSDGVIEARVFAERASGYLLRATAFYGDRAVGRAAAAFRGETASISLKLDEIRLWQPGAPELYDVVWELIDPRSMKTVDSVTSYAALRDVALTSRALTVNGKPVFMRLILDQGFNPEGIYTAPDDGFLKNDIELAMKLGFNGARFHARVFEDRSLYWADRLGYLVWGEYAFFDMELTPDFMADALPEWQEFMEQYWSHPCVIGWICFNETYFAHDLDDRVVRNFYRLSKALDPFRPVIDASGGIHYETDMFDVHEYTQDPVKLENYLLPMKEDEKAFHAPSSRYRGKAPLRKETYCGQPYWISECGGAFWNPGGHEKGWGYGVPENENEFAERYESLTGVMREHPRVCGFCYTQLTDVEQEQNGLYAYDRAPKFSSSVYERIRAANLAAAEIEKTGTNGEK
ncbi:MAG: beta-galactosidase [Clostridia bacterium]|nr:beta-galactosidase [Clostridia bacterium]